MTLSVENLHLAVNRKQGTQTLVSYAQDFATTIKKSIKAVTKWSVHYFTSRQRWYPLPNSAVSLASLQFPKRTKNLPRKTLNSDQKCEMWEWTSVNGAVVGQRSCRQEATMARAETFPENAHFDELTPISSNHHINTNEQSVEKEFNKGEDDVEESEDQIPEYESEGDVGATSSEENDEWHVYSMTNVATFLVGTSSRFGRSMKLNEKYIA